MAISYERPRSTPAAAPQQPAASAPSPAPPSPAPPAPAPAVPAVPSAPQPSAPATAQRGRDGLRTDLSAALAAAHPDVHGDLRGVCQDAVRFLDQHLSATEPIQHIMSIAVSKEASVNSVLVITDRRLIFVAPLPQAISLPLSKITKSQFFGGYFFLNGQGREYSLGWNSISQAATDDFTRRLNHAKAVAELAGL